jgi:hypothetical protein
MERFSHRQREEMLQILKKPLMQLLKHLKPGANQALLIEVISCCA